MSVLTPKFLTPLMAERAVSAAWSAVQSPSARLSLNPKRVQSHVVVLVPSTQDGGPDWNNYPHYTIEPHILYEVSFGRGTDGEDLFEYPFDNIARCKALQLWQGRNDGRTDIQPHLLFEDDSPFWGGVKRHGMVAACSGIQPWSDQAVAGITLDLLAAMGYEAWKTSRDHADDELCFLTRSDDAPAKLGPDETTGTL